MLEEMKANIPEMRFGASSRWYEGAPLGNGDLGTIVFESDDALVFAVGKNDMWDRRFTAEIQPQPKPVCRISVWQTPEETGTGKCSLQPVTHALSLREAELVTCASHLKVVARVQKDRNLVLLRLSGIRRNTIVSLSRPPDSTNTGIAPPRLRISGELAMVEQDLPAEPTYPNRFRCIVAAQAIGAAAPASRPGDIIWQINKDCLIAIAVVTTRDHADPVKRAKKLIQDALQTGDPLLRERHVRAWEKYWAQSWVRIDDPELHGLWYQWMYVLASATRPGAVAPGLFSPWIVEDKSMWHGSYTIDYNFQQTYCAALSSNHPELLDPYFAEVEAMLPAARRLAREQYGRDGLRFPHEMFPISPHDWPWKDGYLVETLWLLQHFWEYYLFTRDESFLAQRCYPIIAECADFVASLMVKGADGAYSLPNYSSLEHPKLPGARNGTPALGLARYILKAAIAGAATLGKGKQARKWSAVLDNLAPYPRSRNQLGEIFVDCESEDDLYYLSPPVELSKGGWRPSKLDGNHGAWMYYNLPNSLMQVWPAGQIDMDSPPEELLTAIRTWMTIKLEGLNNLVSHHVIAARLGIVSYQAFKRDLADRRLPNGFVTTRANRLTPDFDYDSGYFAYWTYGIYTENCCIPLVINEMMLQSHNGVVKVFTAFDPYRKAEFHNLRAQGAFLVSAEVDRGFVKWVEIEPTRSGSCRVRLPWPYYVLEALGTDSSGHVKAVRHADDILFQAQAGCRYRLTPKTKVYRPPKR